jgi:SAM-dependent methyltransferase
MNAVAKLSEQEKYTLMWSHPEYRRCVPGAQVAEQFLRIAQPFRGSTVLDFGCGTGEGALLITLLSDAIFSNPVRVHMLDFARNCLDEDVRNALTTQAQVLEFTQHDLTQPVPVTAQYGFCTDVMEHVPPQDVDKVLTNILTAAQHVFFQISCVDDSCGVLIGETLHLSVHPPTWWKAKFEALKCTLHYWNEAKDASWCVGYVTAWATGQEIVDVGQLNIEEETIRANVRTNLGGGWQQVRPYEPNAHEVMILGGGPSLNGQLDTIRQMRTDGCKLVTLNGAYHWALEHGLTVSAQIVVDARPFNARFTKPVEDKTLYLIGSQCDPTVLEGLPKERTYLWHTTAETIRDILEEKCPGEWFGVPGGCTVLLRAIPLLKMLGYRKFHLFGCDSCTWPQHDGNFTADRSKDVPPPPLHHAYSQPENDGVPIYPVTVGGRVFTCTAWQTAQATEFVSLIKVMGDMFELEVHGNGLLGWILQHGAQIDIERELAPQ